MNKTGIKLLKTKKPEKEKQKILECVDLSFSFNGGSKFVFKDVNLRTYRDELVAIVGPTGTGKSTLLRNLAYLLPPTSGKVLLKGKEVLRPSSNIALIHQSIATFPWMTALENVKLSLKGAAITANEADKRARKMLKLVGLSNVADNYPKEMSGGMRQKIAIARALAGLPSVLLLDEPFVHLDEITAIGLREEIYKIIFNPRIPIDSAILVSHNLHEVVQLADYVYVMNGSPATIVDVVKINLPHPRSERTPAFYRYVDRLLKGLNTTKPIKA
jgi:NitT/TauT family transport system ATP-binding protein